MLCYVMVCYGMLWYVMICYVLLWYGMLWYVMLCFVMVWYVILCKILSSYCFVYIINLMLKLLCITVFIYVHVLSYVTSLIFFRCFYNKNNTSTFILTKTR